VVIGKTVARGDGERRKGSPAALKNKNVDKGATDILTTQKRCMKIAEKRAEKPYRPRNNSGGGDFFRRALVGAFGLS
jgi:hypothetical protein